MARINPRAAARYLEDGAKFCPICSKPGHITRPVADARFEQVFSGKPRLVVPCDCTACEGSWVETYTLFSVTIIGGGQ